MTQESQQLRATGELLLAGFVEHEDFVAFVNAYSIASDVVPLLLAERQPDQVIAPEERQELLHFARFDPYFDLAPYTSGRVFHEHGELRWERQHEWVQIVYTGKHQYRPERKLEQTEQYSLEEAVKCDRSYLLFGKRLDLDSDRLQHLRPVARAGDFAEVRIPRLLRYPALDTLAKAERIQLVVCEYLHPDTGMNIAYRFKGLVPFKQKVEQSGV